jgi:thiamine-phosphate pyrophosphorylase
MTFSLPKIYPITDPSITGLSHLEQVRQLVKGGAKFIQLRDKHSSPKEFYQSAEAVMKFTRGTDVKILINDRIDIALAVKADGVHLGQDDLSPAKARRILGESAIIGFSTHNPEQAVEAVTLPIDYFAFGPIFPTRTKENPDPAVGLDGIKKIRELIGDFPLVAIGGIDFENYRRILRSGADSVAIISAILRPPPLINETFETFVKHI